MLAPYIPNHVQQALARQMQQYLSLPQQYLMVLENTPPFIPTGTYTPFFTTTAATTLPFGYGSLLGIGQAFHVSSALSVGQVTAYFQAAGKVSDGYVAAYLYGDNGQSPDVHAAPAGGPIARSVELYSTYDIATDFYNNSGAGPQARVFTFDVPLPIGYYWIIFSSNYPASPGNSLLLGTENTGGLALANGYGAGDDITGLFGPSGFTGTRQLALNLAEKISAPPLQPGNTLAVSGVAALIASLSDQIQGIENATYSLNEGRQLYNGTIYPAIGTQLDGIGVLVGQNRNGQDDMTYLIFILGRIGSNYSNSTIPEIASLISLLFQTDAFKLFPMYPAEINIQIPSTAGLDPSLYPQAIQLIGNSAGAGIGIGFGSIVPPNPFLFSSVARPIAGGGFGTSSDPSIGGKFAGTFYSNPGA